jgi:hypothetical protein
MSTASTTSTVPANRATPTAIADAAFRRLDFTTKMHNQHMTVIALDAVMEEMARAIEAKKDELDATVATLSKKRVASEYVAGCFHSFCSQDGQETCARNDL